MCNPIRGLQSNPEDDLYISTVDLLLCLFFSVLSELKLFLMVLQIEIDLFLPRSYNLGRNKNKSLRFPKLKRAIFSISEIGGSGGRSKFFICSV